MQVRSPTEGLNLVPVATFVVLKARMQRLMDIADEVNDVFQGLEPLAVWSRRRQNRALSLDGGNDTVSVGTVT